MVASQSDFTATVRAELAEGRGDALAALAARLKAVGEPTRARLLVLLGEGPDEGLTVTDLWPATGLSQPVVSHHLSILNEAGLVNRRKAGVWTFYTPNTEAMEALGDNLAGLVGTLTERKSRRRRLKAKAAREAEA